MIGDGSTGGYHVSIRDRGTEVGYSGRFGGEASRLYTGMFSVGNSLKSMWARD